MSYRIILVNNYYNSHTIGLVDEFYKQTNGNFLALETSTIEEFRKKIGWKPIERVYIDKYENHIDDVLNADVVIYGGSNIDKILSERIPCQGSPAFPICIAFSIPINDKITAIKYVVIIHGKMISKNLALFCNVVYKL